MRVFDPKLWNGKDVGDNDQFFKEADILSYDGDGTFTIRFHHDNRISRGHFLTIVKDDEREFDEGWDRD